MTYEYITKWSHGLVVGLSLVGISLSIGILGGWLWVEDGAPLADRANISTAVATVFALFAAFFALSAGLWVTTTDYRAQQAAKKDTARLRAAIQWLSDKADAPTGRTPQHRNIDTFQAEREALTEFVHSTTAFGYRKWVVLERGRERSWQEFFPSVTYLVDACQPPADPDRILRLSRGIQRTLDLLNAKDLHRISALAGDLTGEFRFPTPNEVANEIGEDKIRKSREATIAAARRGIVR